MKTELHLPSSFYWGNLLALCLFLIAFYFLEKSYSEIGISIFYFVLTIIFFILSLVIILGLQRFRGHLELSRNQLFLYRLDKNGLGNIGKELNEKSIKNVKFNSKFIIVEIEDDQPIYLKNTGNESFIDKIKEIKNK